MTTQDKIEKAKPVYWNRSNTSKRLPRPAASMVYPANISTLSKKRKRNMALSDKKIKLDANCE